MALTYTEIEQEKNTKILIFFGVVIFLYFAIAFLLASAVKIFILMQGEGPARGPLFLTIKEAAIVLLVSLLAAFIHSFYSVTRSMPLIRKNLGAHEADRNDRYHERFVTIIDEVNVATGNKYRVTPVVLPVMALNAFAISDHRKNAVIGVTEGLLSKLNRQQLLAVVAHEMAHVVSGDSFQTTVGCALFGIYAAILRGMGKMFRGTKSGGTGGKKEVSVRAGGNIVIFILFVYLLLSVMQFFYTIIRFMLSRSRELRADAISVRITRDPVSLSEALYIISSGWRGMGEIDDGLEPLFILNPVKKENDEKESFWANLMSTHPPVARRMSILAAMAHADVKNIKEEVLAREKAKIRPGEEQEHKEELLFMARDKKDAWKGPFNIAQIMTLGWIRPDTMVMSLDSEKTGQAGEEPLLRPVFDEKLKGLSVCPETCPKCGQSLVEEEYEGTSVKRCVFCGGALVEQDRMPRIIIRREKGSSERIRKTASIALKNGLERQGKRIRMDAETLLNCPKCGEKMLRNPYTLAYPVEVDRCVMCNLVWFDKDELEMVQYLIEEAE